MRNSNFLVVLQTACALLSAAAAESPALKAMFASSFMVGGALNPRHFSGRDPEAAQLVAKHFNTITPENVMKWGNIHPRRDAYDFSAADLYVAFGEKEGMFIVGHTLIWHQQTPKWVFEDDKGRPADRERLLARMQEHIHTVVGRYKGRVKGWDVVNEALDEDGKLRNTPWLKIIGPDYIQKAFEFAREADSQAELYYNDYSLENPSKRKGALKLIQALISNGIHVSAVGLQGHYDLKNPSPARLQETLSAFSEMGVKCMITELDVDVLPSSRGSSADLSRSERARKNLDPYPESLPPKKQRELARRYAQIFRVLVRNADFIDRVTFWGVTDADSWLNNWPVRGRTNYPLLFDRQGQPKPAYDAVAKTADQ